MLELLTTGEMADADRLAIAGGVPGITLMENAGRAVADCVAQRHPPGTKVIVLAGPGNNGGDGFVAARLLEGRGYSVRLMLEGARERLKGDAAEAASRWRGGVEDPAPDSLSGAHVVIDALYGAGLARPVDGRPRGMIEAINASGVPIVAVDLPSGINGTSGAVMGAAVKAERTVTFFRRKPGHVLLPGRLHCGTVSVADIGIPAVVLDAVRPRTFLNVPELWGAAFPVPAITAHKYARGHALVVSGDVSHTGAARLAARGALRAGAGLITIASPRDALAVHAAANIAVMVRAVDGPDELGSLLADRRISTLVLGPGGGVDQNMRGMVRVALENDRDTVLDADAITAFAEHGQLLFEMIARRDTAATVLTPHEGEFARLFHEDGYELHNASKLDRARDAAQRSGAVILLKGPDTVVAAPDGRACIAENARSWLSTAGSGDVLAGFVAGLLAQGMPAFETAAAAVWLHGDAGNEAGPGLIAEDTPDVIPTVYRRLLRQLGHSS